MLKPVTLPKHDIPLRRPAGTRSSRATEATTGACRRPPEAGGRHLRRGWLAGHPRRRQRCYCDGFALPLWIAVVDWPAGGALLPLPLPLKLPLPLPRPLLNE